MGVPDTLIRAGVYLSTPASGTGVKFGTNSSDIVTETFVPMQGTDSNILSSRTVSGVGASLCTDANLGATTSGCPAASGLSTSAPLWLRYLGSGTDGSNTNASGSLGGELYYTNFTVPFGNTVTVSNSSGLVIHVTGTCTFAGTINASGTLKSKGIGGGGGGGAAGGKTGSSVTIAGTAISLANGSTGGSTSGGNGGKASATSTHNKRAMSNSGGGIDRLFFSGGDGKAGANSSGVLGFAGLGVVLICSSITGTDGTHTGTIDVSGQYGSPAAANSTRSGSGGGVAILSSQSTIVTPPSIYVAGGPGSLVTVPHATGTSGSCTSPPKATLGVSAGALSGSCTVAHAGAGCGTGTNVTFNVLGGGGTLGTGTVNPTWSGGTLASCTATAGSSSGYTAATFTTAGTGGDGAAGWNYVVSRW